MSSSPNREQLANNSENNSRNNSGKIRGTIGKKIGEQSGNNSGNTCSNYEFMSDNPEFKGHGMNGRMISGQHMRKHILWLLVVLPLVFFSMGHRSVPRTPTRMIH